MRVQQFNSEDVSIFNEKNLVTELHAHPALEIIIAHKGVFTLRTPNQILKSIKFGLVKPNVWHRLQAEDCECELIMVELGFSVLQNILMTANLPNNNNEGILALDLNLQSVLTKNKIESWAKISRRKPIYDARILKSIQFIKNNKNATSLALADLANQVYLSPDRLSHLFKDQLGLSIQKYMVWHRLKLAVELILKKEKNLTQAAHTAGFYDVAHFSKHFKEMLGIKPSAVYNSGIIQG